MPEPFTLLLAGLVKLGVRKEIGDMAKIPGEPIKSTPISEIVC